MRIAWPASSVLLLLAPLACSTVAPLDTEAGTTSEAQGTTDTSPTGNDDETTLPQGTTADSVDPSTFPTTSAGTEASSTVPDTTTLTSVGTTGVESTGGVDTTNATDTTDTTSAESSSSTGEPPPGCDDGQQNQDETDIDCGGGTCSPCDDDQACLDAPDCTSGVCTDMVCIAATCDDGVQNQDESDVDCGGAVCDLCTDGDSCVDSGDCESGVCDADICQPPSCDDNAFNQDETDVDCGGAVCDACGDGQSCAVDDDCVSVVCTNDVCAAPTCEDQTTNQDETDVDCGGAKCAPCQLPGLIINEVDYDQAGVDTLEFIEIYNNTGGPVSLVGVHVVLINGSNQATYNPNTDLSAQVALAQGAYLVVGSAGVVVPPGVAKVQINNDVIQNGAPDGIALVDTVNMKLLDSLSYEGSITNATVTGLGMGINLVEGTAFPTADAGNGAQSIARFPNGNDKNDAMTDFVLSKNPTPGAANTK